MSENKTGKYLKYAIGEIVLVVIGILIALQVNNWNENRKYLKNEKATISNLKLEFQQNLGSLEADTKAIEAFINASKTLLEHTGPDYEFGTLKSIDSLINMSFRMAVWDPSLYTLSEIENSGRLSNLTNENLKILLIEWDSFYSNLLDWADFYVDRGTAYFDYLTKNGLNRALGTMVPSEEFRKSRFDHSNEELLLKIEFENLLVDRVNINGGMLGFYKQAHGLLTEIIAECDSYNK